MISCFARYSPEKGLGFLTDAAAKLRSLTKRPFKCVICGDGELFGEVKEQIARLGLEGCVVQAGYRTDTAEILRASDLYVNSSSSEAMSFALLEAMNEAVPLVVTELEGNCELALDEDLPCGLAAPYGDADAFASAMLRLMEDGELYRRYSENALARVKRDYDIEKLAQKVLESYK